MASLIKNQIIKRLSKFVKNLTPNQINLSTLKGEGELSSISLDEKALEDVIELPTWLRISKATCGRVFIKIPWRNLKNLPIQIQLDDVLIEIETCEKLRDLHRPSSGNDPSIGKYGFTNRVIDGISLTITNLTLAIKAQHFKASIFLPSFDIYSTAPNGKRVDTLTLTRLRNSTKTHILVFKEISWPNARIEASSIDNNLQGTAIRFIANSCRIRISVKKNIQDSTMVTSRLMIQFDDFLSVVNNAQLKSALNTYKEIKQLIKQASNQRKESAGIKLERQPSTFQPKLPTTGINESMNQFIKAQQSNDPFTLCDIIETSMHLIVKRLDLHIVSDSADRLVENGSVQMTIANLSIDHYPYHEFNSSRKHWIRYNENQSVNRNEWAMKLHEEWHQQFNLAKASVPNDNVSIKFERALRTNLIRLFESCTILNIDDLVFYPVSLNKDKQQKRRRPLITSDKTYLQLPDSLGIINIQHSEYYYPSPYSFPVPNSNLYIQIMPLVFRIDFATFNWLHAFISILSITIDNSGVFEKIDEPKTDSEHIGIKLEAILPRIVLSSDIFQSSQGYKHDAISNEQQFEILELNISKFVITNTRIDSISNRNKLEKDLQLFKNNHFFQQTQWPFSNTTTTRISPLFEKYPYDTYLYNNPLSKKTCALPQSPSASNTLHNYYTMTTDSLKKAAKYDIWHFDAGSFYLDFTPASSGSIKSVKQNITDSLSLTGWIVFDEQEKNSCLNILGIIENPSMIKISQKQFTFIMLLIDEIGLFVDQLELNTTQADSIKPKSSSQDSSNPTKISVCLTSSNTFTLVVIDGLADEVLELPTPRSSSLLGCEMEPTMHETSDINVLFDLIPTPVPITASTTKIESSIPNKDLKKSKAEETIQRGLELASNGFRSRSITSLSTNMSDYGDETASQLDATEDLDADLDPSLFINDFEQQQEKVTRIELDDDDSISLTGKNYMTTTASETINGVFIKLNQISACLTENDEQPKKPIYIACNAKYLRIDEFFSLKFDTIKPKLFENERPDEINNENVPPINIRIDLPEVGIPSPPIITLKFQDRLLTTTTHAIDVILENLEEIFTSEEKLIRLSRPPKLAPIDVHLTNVQVTLKLLPEYSKTHAIVENKRPTKINIEDLHILRQIDGQIIIRDDKKQIIPSLPQSSFNNDSEENLQELKLLRLENEQLRSELNSRKTEITVLRGERDTLMSTISKLDIELTQAEYQRISQQQQLWKK